jgi:8-oxo-dGTP pyrophosphatase MutT (NUDIX family)
MPLDIDNLLLKISARLKEPLPGSIAHEPLRAVPTGDVRPNFEHKTPPKPGSVLILLFEEQGYLYFPLTQRADYVGAHGGQISLPGGKAEEGETPIQTALREAQEEIGIDPSKVEIMGTLSQFFVIPSNFMVTPVVGFYRTTPIFTPDPIEVVKILKGNVDELVRDDAVHAGEIIAARIYKMNAPHFLIDGHIVWGATAMMLNELRIILREMLGAPSAL